MSDEPVLSQFAVKLDPLDHEGIKQFHRIVDYVSVCLEKEERYQLIDRLNTGIAMLELASITGEAAFRFRSELVAAAQAIDKAVQQNQRGAAPNSAA